MKNTERKFDYIRPVPSKTQCAFVHSQGKGFARSKRCGTGLGTNLDCGGSREEQHRDTISISGMCRRSTLKAGMSWRSDPWVIRRELQARND